MASISGANIINYDYLLRNCYSSNRMARKGASRSSYSNTELLSADSDALRKLAKNLQEISYDKEDGKNIYNNAKALIETYNNTIGSADKLSSSELERNAKKLKQFVKDNKDALEEIGIKVTTSGKMELNKEKMLETSASKMEKVLSGSGGFSKTVEKYAKTLRQVAQKLIREEAAKKKKAENADNSGTGTANTTSTTSAGPNSVNFLV